MTGPSNKERTPHEAGPPRPRQAPRPTPNAGVERIVGPRVATPRPETESALGRPRGGPPQPRGVR